MTTKAELMNLFDQRDEIDAQIDKATADLKLDAKAVKEIRKAQAKVAAAALRTAAAQKTLDAMMEIDPSTAEKIAAEGTK